MSQLYELQQEIASYMLGQACDYKLLDKPARDDLGIYKSLILNSMENYLPIAFKRSYILLADNWRNIVRDYYEHCPSSSPVYYKLAQKFPQFLASDFFKGKYTYPSYLSELALYEWTELELYNSEAIHNRGLSINPLHQILHCEHPISSIIEYLQDAELEVQEKRNTEVEPEAEDIIIYRDPYSLQIRFFVLSPETLFVVNRFQKNGNNSSLEQIFSDLCNTYKLEANPQLEKSFYTLIENLKNLNILIE